MAKRSQRKKAPNREIPAKVAGTATIASTLPTWFTRDWVWGLILLVAVILAYQPVWYAGFIWDDDGLITANPCIIEPLGLIKIWTTSAADICPLTLTMFWMEHALWGLDPLGYHLVNVLQHGACAILLWRVLRSLEVPGAWLGAALWALHPVQVESVAWISETKNTQSGLFFMLSILFFVRWLRAQDTTGSNGGGWNYALTLLFAALAMASKSSTVILPVVLCLCAWWVEGRWHWRNLARTAPLFLTSIAASGLSIWTQKLVLATVPDPQWERTWPERVAASGDAIWFYLGKLVWPHPLITIYPRWEIDAGQWFSYLPLLAAIIVLVILWLNRDSWARPWFFVFAYFLVALLPVLGLVDNSIFRYSLVFDHFQYLASMGPLALAGAGLTRLADFVILKKPWLPSTLGAGVLLILGLLSWQRTWVYKNVETLWTDTLTKNPNCWAAHFNLGLALSRKGQVDEAISEAQKALEINPNYASPRIILGNALVQKGQMDEAMAQYQKALEISPTYALAHNDLGNILAQKGQMDEAMAQYQEALENNPNYADAHNNLGNVLVQKGQIDTAMVEYQKALEINPDYADAHNNLGELLLQKKQLDRAMAQFKEAIRLNPHDSDAQNNLYKAQAMMRQAPGSK